MSLLTSFATLAHTPDQRSLVAVEELRVERLGQLRLAHARRAQEQEGALHINTQCYIYI